MSMSSLVPEADTTHLRNLFLNCGDFILYNNIYPCIRVSEKMIYIRPYILFPLTQEIEF